jgi:predicted CoA-binding protein
LAVTPINPGSSAISALGKDYPTAASLSALPFPTETSVSIITPPGVTRKVLEEAKALGIPAVWLQPGTFDDEVIALAREEGVFKAAVGGTGGGTRGPEGWCILVDGERALKAAEKL